MTGSRSGPNPIVDEPPTALAAASWGTEWAFKGRHTGSTDLPLLPEGEAEARRLAPVLSQHSFAAMFSFPLQRAGAPVSWTMNTVNGR